INPADNVKESALRVSSLRNIIPTTISVEKSPIMETSILVSSMKRPQLNER
ncbi:hypothetical protein J6590_102519, partial [Homalodisca vitripennis]